MLRSIASVNMTMAEFAEMNVQDTSAFMGLENYLCENSSNEIRYRRDAIRKAVLSEQDRQHYAYRSLSDPDQLANVSRQISYLSVTRSYVIGMMHAEKGTAVEIHKMPQSLVQQQK